MNENSLAATPADNETASQTASSYATFSTWIVEGLRAGIFLRPRVAGLQPRATQLLALFSLLSLIEMGLGRLEIVEGAALFDMRAWLGPLWSTAALALMLWGLLPSEPVADRPKGAASWLALWFMAVVPAELLYEGFAITEARGIGPDWLPASVAVGRLLQLWTLAVAIRLVWSFGLARRRLFGFAAGVMFIFTLNAWQFPEHPWRALEELTEDQRPQLALSQETFEAQQRVWRSSVEALAPQRPGVTDVYALVFAPYAEEDVFLRESTMVANVLADRFDARGRVLQMVNHATTAETHPWATPLNLKRGIEALAKRMDTEHDLLVVYLTSHGANDFRLAADNWPLEVPGITPRELREAMDAAGIRNRVIAISACFSGGWVGPLASDSTLVMTAADADHTSYGCGRLSELTFFGRAVFDEQLRKTHSFEQAFTAAVPLIRQREEQAGKDDGFSNPQISVGEKIRPVLRDLDMRLENAAPPRQATPSSRIPT